MSVYCITCHQEIRKQRTHAQNELYWGYCVEPLAKHLAERGYTKDDVHELLKLECNGRVLMVPEGDFVIGVKIPQSTTILTTKGYSEFIDRVIQYAAKLGCVLYMPGDPKE